MKGGGDSITAYRFKDIGAPSGFLMLEYFFAMSCENFRVCILASSSFNWLYSGLVGWIWSAKTSVIVNGLLYSGGVFFMGISTGGVEGGGLELAVMQSTFKYNYIEFDR